jgi:DNA-binding MarR family transcriptional regulator
MTKFTSYVPLIEKWEQYLKTPTEHTLEGFARWVLKFEVSSKKTMVSESFDEYFESHSAANGNEINTARAGYFIGRMYKYVKHYTKPMLAEIGLGNLDEFGLLAALDEKAESNKKDLIIDNLIEITTGMDILRRLYLQGFIKEKTNKKDKREKLISITPKGQRTLYRMYAGFGQLPDVLADLEQTQRKSLVATLLHLDKFHKNQIKNG